MTTCVTNTTETEQRIRGRAADLCRYRELRIPVIPAIQSGGMPATCSGASRPGSECSDAGHSVICHTWAVVSSPPGFFASSPRLR